MRGTVTVADDVAKVGAERFLACGREAIARDDGFYAGLSGGNTPRELYRRLQPNDLPWDTVDLFFGDERCVPRDHELSNFRMVRESLLDRVPVRAHFLHDPQEYEELLRVTLGERGRFDLLLLGMGEDGHTASLFPGSPALGEGKRWVVAAPGVPPAAERLTITPVLIRAAYHVVVLVSGERKARILADALEGPPGTLPVQLVGECQGEVEWIVDPAAASCLRRVPTA